MNIYDLARSQAAELDRLKDEVTRLRSASTMTSPEPACRQVRKGKTRTLAQRVNMSAGWTREKRAAKSKAMREYWAMELHI